MTSNEEKINDILLSYEDQLSDGFGYYTDDVTETLYKIARDIIKAIK